MEANAALISQRAVRLGIASKTDLGLAAPDYLF